MKTSIIILTRNQLAMTRNCLDSIRRHTPEDYEIIIVDNGSTDDTVSYMKEQSDIILHENNENVGFGKGCNQGVELATGDNILFLNNDTVVAKDWLTSMLRSLYSDSRVGMVGPVTNYCSGHHQIPVTYTEIDQMEDFAEKLRETNKGVAVEVRRLVGFCLLVKRSVLDEVGVFDEQFGLGNYEDDDLSLRVIRAGYRLLVVHDSYIHHIGHATMNQLQGDSLQSLLHENSVKALVKWGKDIHQLIYRPQITISACIVVPADGQLLEASLDSLQEVADEIIIVDQSGQEKELQRSSSVPTKVYINEGEHKNTASSAYRFAQDISSKEYVLHLQGDEILTAEEQRRLAGLKLSIREGAGIAPVQCGGKQCYVTLRSIGYVSFEEIRS